MICMKVLLTNRFCSVPVALGVVTINETIDKGDSADLLLALKHKNVALRSVTPECAQQYRDDLKSAKDKKEDPSKLVGNSSYLI